MREFLKWHGIILEMETGYPELGLSDVVKTF